MHSSLAEHRHGRYLAAQLGAVASACLPDNGMMLMHGKVYQACNKDEQDTYWQWSAQSGCALLLLPPFERGRITPQLDWQWVLRDATTKSAEGVVPHLVADEVSGEIEGVDGEFDRAQSHQWSDYSVNTRFAKKHSGAGVFAASCLPLWSISLLDHADDTLAWLMALLDYAGDAQAAIKDRVNEQDVPLEPTDYTLMVCIEALQLRSVADIDAAMNNLMLGTFSLDAETINAGVERLLQAGLMSDQGLTDSGIKVLQHSPYWVYVDRLREESRP